MEYKTIIVDMKNNISIIKLNQPKKRNPISRMTALELNDALLNAEKDDNVRVVILTGAGDSFSAGADLSEFSQNMQQTPVQLFNSGRESTELFKTGLRYSKPLIGAINGHAFAGGFGLVAMCHIAIAANVAKFSMPEIKLGLFPLVIMPLVRRAIGDKKALELSIKGLILTAEEAKSIGLVEEVVPKGEVMIKAMALAEEISTRSPLGTRMGLIAFYETTHMEPLVAMEYLNTIRVIIFKSEDLEEGAKAFLEKRQPVFKGK